jgi:hypothetical protein
MLNPIAPANTFPAAITFSASGGPTGATYTFLPATIAQGSGATSVILTVSVPSATTANLTEPWTTPSQAVSRYIPGHLRFNYNSKLSLLALFMLPLAGKFRKAGRRFYKVTPTILLLFSCVAIGASICSCGGSSNSSTTSKQASGNYTITVTASSGANTQSTTFGLKVN